MTRETEIREVVQAATEVVVNTMLGDGLKHPVGSWRQQSYVTHLEHMLEHVTAALADARNGRVNRLELEHAGCRGAMAYVVRPPDCSCVHPKIDVCGIRGCTPINDGSRDVRVPECPYCDAGGRGKYAPPRELPPIRYCECMRMADELPLVKPGYVGSAHPIPGTNLFFDPKCGKCVNGILA